VPSLSFRKCWKPKILSGEKRQTIRVKGKRVYKPGDTLHLFTGMRTKSCERLGRARCIGVADIRYEGPERWRFLGQTGKPTFALAWCRRGRLLDLQRLRDLAVTDGFDGIASLERWFAKCPPGTALSVISWRSLVDEKGDPA